MINLIPQSAKKSVIREYWLRVLAVWLFLLGTGCLVVASLLLPTYVRVKGERLSLEAVVSQNAEVAATYDSSASALTVAMEQAQLLSTAPDAMAFSFYGEQILQYAGNNINIRNINYVRNEDTVAIALEGTATDRQNLAAFRDNLEADSLFADAILPISSLIKDKNLEFNMTLSGLATTTP